MTGVQTCALPIWIEPQTLKLFEVCRLRDIPIVTFINKMDREAQDPFALLDEIASKLALDPAPLYWPAGSGGRFKGMLDLRRDLFLPFAKQREAGPDVQVHLLVLDRPPREGDTASKKPVNQTRWNVPHFLRWRCWRGVGRFLLLVRFHRWAAD